MIIGMDDISSNWFFNKLDFIKLMSVSIHSYVFMQDIYQCNWFSGSCFPLKMLNRIWKYMYTAICRARFKIPLIFQLGDSRFHQQHAKSKRPSLCWHQRRATETPTKYDGITAGRVALPASKKCSVLNNYFAC